MLIAGIQNRVFVPPLQEVKSQFEGVDAKTLTHAAKITPKDRHINWREWSWTEIERRQRVLGSLWSVARPSSPRKVSDKEKYDPILAEPMERRVIFQEIEEISPDTVPEGALSQTGPGLPFTLSSTQRKRHDKALYVYSADNKLLRLNKLKFEGERFNDALIAAQKAHMFAPDVPDTAYSELIMFLNKLA